MKKILEELNAKIDLRAEKLDELKKLNAKENLTDGEVSNFEALQAQLEKLDREITVARNEFKLSMEEDVVMGATAQEEDIERAVATADYRNAFDKYLEGELQEVKAEMTVGVDADGGYIVPESYQRTVIEKLNILGRTRAISNVMMTDSTLNIPIEGDAPTFAWIDEGGAYGETKSTFGQKQIKAYKLGGIIKVSEELLQDNMINFDAYMAVQIAKGIDKAEAPAFATGDGTGKPTGYSIAGTVGTNSTTAAVNAVTADEIIDIYYDLKEEYRANSTWRMNDKTEKAIRKLKDVDGNYIYSPALNDGERPALLGRPIVIDNSLPDMAASAKFIVIGDFNYYHIADRGSLSIQRLNELYAGTGFVGFKVKKRVDAQVSLSEAFNVGQNAAA